MIHNHFQKMYNFLIFNLYAFLKQSTSPTLKVSHIITSGAIQYGVPIKVSRLSTVRAFLAETPKSAGKVFSDIKTLNENTKTQLKLKSYTYNRNSQTSFLQYIQLTEN